MLLGRILGWLLIALALLALGGDGLRWLETGMMGFIALGDFWARLDPPTHSLLLTIGHDYLPPVLWDPGLATVLRWPAVAVLGGLGILLLVLFRKREPKRRQRFGALS
ncbi:MAG: hypothetical protein OJJ21_24055 [Ferrovibrio sp.]|uniref:hypothetical protein n=1 Tax=Ferrovibrio sp. TaxID=1917215 RepID=UPI002637F96B|nr:hypothetical protein [Ferrovibrio sp.]MCW0236692.1 hypothetical protein [Ferrovibrio sp.]